MHRAGGCVGGQRRRWQAGWRGWNERTHKIWTGRNAENVGQQGGRGLGDGRTSWRQGRQRHAPSLALGLAPTARWRQAEPGSGPGQKRRAATSTALTQHGRRAATRWWAERAAGHLAVRARWLPVQRSPLELGLHQHILIQLSGMLPAQVLLHAPLLQAPAGSKRAGGEPRRVVRRACVRVGGRANAGVGRWERRQAGRGHRRCEHSGVRCSLRLQRWPCGRQGTAALRGLRQAADGHNVAMLSSAHPACALRAVGAASSPPEAVAMLAEREQSVANGGAEAPAVRELKGPACTEGASEGEGRNSEC